MKRGSAALASEARKVSCAQGNMLGSSAEADASGPTKDLRRRNMHEGSADLTFLTRRSSPRGANRVSSAHRFGSAIGTDSPAVSRRPRARVPSAAAPSARRPLPRAAQAGEARTDRYTAADCGPNHLDGTYANAVAHASGIVAAP